MTTDETKPGHHPRSRHRAPYDFDRLTAAHPPLSTFLAARPDGATTIDFGDPAAVRALNHALLATFYGVTRWALPADALCPPVPGRADHVHAVADLLRGDADDDPPRDAITALDVGVGASCIYPILGRHEYGWRFVASDADPVALESARAIVDGNADLAGAVELRTAPSPDHVFDGVVRDGDRFDVTLCNPPFHASAEEAAEANRRKRRGLGGRSDAPRNFGGRDAELWCEGGERGFLKRMIAQSAGVAPRCRWFTALVSRKETLRSLERALARVEAREVRLLAVHHGNKTSRILAWTFMTNP